VTALATLAAAVAAPATAGALRPSEYTAALVQVMRARADWVRGARALEIGPGSGVVLAALGELGARSLCGIDIENKAVAESALLLHALGHGAMLELHRGDMWGPVTTRRFDLIVANLPQFPMAPQAYAGRLSSWSAGGRDGRDLLDRFLGGLPGHLAPGGRAVITHNGFVDLERTREFIAAIGLSMRVPLTVLVNLPPEKLRLMSPHILLAEEGRSIFRYGPYAFGQMHVIEIGAGLA
jgi:release factor glutamine methyltransferase